MSKPTPITATPIASEMNAVNFNNKSKTLAVKNPGE